MATTRIISMHVNQGKTIADCLTDRIDYSKNPDKTQGGELISAYECDPKTADAEFLYSKRQYKTLTGREQQSDVIAYQVRQSFKPGEITPEDANRVGYEFAERFLKGRHAFFVATHTDKKHIHNHIIWNSTTLDCKHKFRDFLGSGRAVARLSDAICTEHRLSVIADPKRGVNHYGRWLGNKAKPSHRELLCGLIDAALLQKPDSFDTLLKLLRDAGCEVRRRGNTLSLRHPDRKGFIRLSSIENYTEDELRAVLAGEKEHTPRKKRTQATRKKNTLLIDIEAKLQAGKGGGYEPLGKGIQRQANGADLQLSPGAWAAGLRGTGGKSLCCNGTVPRAVCTDQGGGNAHGGDRRAENAYHQLRQDPRRLCGLPQGGLLEKVSRGA